MENLVLLYKEDTAKFRYSSKEAFIKDVNKSGTALSIRMNAVTNDTSLIDECAEALGSEHINSLKLLIRDNQNYIKNNNMFKSDVSDDVIDLNECIRYNKFNIGSVYTENEYAELMKLLTTKL